MTRKIFARSAGNYPPRTILKNVKIADKSKVSEASEIAAVCLDIAVHITVAAEEVK